MCFACFGDMYNIIKKDGAFHGLDPPSTFVAVAMMAKMKFEGPGTRQLQLQRLHHSQQRFLDFLHHFRCY